jgi:hypothetical protein
VRKQFQKILKNILKHQKYLENFQNSRKIPDTLWDTSNPNKILGAQEKDLEPSNK